MKAATSITAEEAARLFEPLASYPRLAVAVSGGADSMALLHLLHRWCALRGAGPELTVLTVDHGLRAQSRDEASMVARVASGLGVPHALLTWTELDKSAGGLQDAARRARYRLMAEHCQLHDIQALVTAHHLDDQAETLLMRLKRGSGLDGLAAIPEVSTWAGIEVLRPLLLAPKDRLIATLTVENISWAEDPSNADPRFERVRVRAAMPKLAEVGLTPEVLARSAQRLTRARAALDHATQNFLAAHSNLNAAGYGLLQGDALGAAPDEIVLRALARLIQAIGARDEPVRLVKLEALLDALKSAPAKTHTLGGCRIEPLADRLALFRETRGMGLAPLALAPGSRALWDNRFTIELSGEAEESVVVRALGEKGFNAARSDHSWLAAVPRRAGVTLPACWRDDELLALPDLGQSGATRGLGVYFQAQFVHARLPQSRMPKFGASR